MLDRHKLVIQISCLIEKLFPDLKNQTNLAKLIWDRISKDPLFVQKVLASKSSFLIPEWQNNLDDIFKIDEKIEKYSVLAVDGSQIYPDRHISGANCFLINIGGCFLNYNKDIDQKLKSKVNFFSEPNVYLTKVVLLENENISFSSDLVDLKREELELKNLFLQANQRKENSNLVCFVDGSLIFWHLEGKQPEVKTIFLNSYLSILNNFYENNILIAGYISFTKSKELVNLIRLGLCRFTIADCISCHSQYEDFPCKVVDSLIDSQVARFFLKPFERTTIFWNNSKITQHYPDALKPCFFYLHVGKEIVRIETMAWIAKETQYVDIICSVALDQSLKGQGYPVVLTEAHEQAVVKGQDRDFFYHLIHKIGIDQKKRFFVSQKSLKKRGIGV